MQTSQLYPLSHTFTYIWIGLDLTEQWLVVVFNSLFPASDSNILMLKRWIVEKYMDLFLSLPSTIEKSVSINVLIW